MPRGGKRPNAGRKPKSPNEILKSEPKSKPPAEQPAPRADTRWKPGQSGNPKGRPSNVGSTINEWLNLFGDKNLSEDELRKIAKDRKEPWPKRAAANRALRTMEVPDLADFQDAVDGVEDLKSLRSQGVNTELVKKLKVKTRTLPAKDGEDPVTEIEREIELHDRAGEDFDRIMDRTMGRPTQAIKLDADVKYKQPSDGEAAADSLLAGLAKCLGVAAVAAAGNQGTAGSVSDRAGGAESQP